MKTKQEIYTDFVPLIDFVRQNRLSYNKVYQATLKGIIRSIRKGNRIYICKTDIKIKGR